MLKSLSQIHVTDWNRLANRLTDRIESQFRLLLGTNPAWNEVNVACGKPKFPLLLMKHFPA